MYEWRSDRLTQSPHQLVKDSPHLFFLAFFKPTTQNAFDRFRFLHDIQIFISDAAQPLAKMKRRPLLIITARGDLVSETALIKVLREGLMAGRIRRTERRTTPRRLWSMRNLVI
jgi:hypothetical protein